MLQPGRKFTAGSGYRYGFNGKENDNEVSGDGNQYDYGFRIYNPRIGRFLSQDPLFKSYPWYTPYQFAGNKPIMCIDLDGLEEKQAIEKSGYDFSKAKNFIPRKEYEDHGNWLYTFTYNTIVENNVGNNLSRAIVNQVVQSAEDVTNLVASNTGRKQVIRSYAYSVAMIFELGIMMDKDPALGLHTAKAFFSNPENVENLAATGFLMLLGRYLPSLKFSLLKNVLSTTYQFDKLIIGPKVVKRVTAHLKQFGVKAENTVMLDRLKRIANKEIEATQIDLNFAKHELREAELMKKGLKYEDAHEQTLREQGMYHRDYEKKLYTEDAIKKGNKQMEKEATSK